MGIATEMFDECHSQAIFCHLKCVVCPSVFFSTHWQVGVANKKIKLADGFYPKYNWSAKDFELAKVWSYNSGVLL